VSGLHGLFSDTTLAVQAVEEADNPAERRCVRHRMILPEMDQDAEIRLPASSGVIVEE
jgi:hypothetical protein